MRAHDNQNNADATVPRVRRLSEPFFASAFSAHSAVSFCLCLTAAVPSMSLWDDFQCFEVGFFLFVNSEDPGLHYIVSISLRVSNTFALPSSSISCRE